MPMQVVNTATLMCTSGSVPSQLIVTPIHRVQVENQNAANIGDHVPIMNICPFGTCAQLLGPCVPATPMPWAPGAPTVVIDTLLALDDPSTLTCTNGGVISIVDPGQHTVFIP